MLQQQISNDQKSKIIYFQIFIREKQNQQVIQMQLDCTHTIAQTVIENIITHIDTAIGQIQVSNFLPIYLNQQLYSPIQLAINAIVPQHQSKPGALTQQKLDAVPKLKFDNLMPKEVAKQTIEVSQPSFVKTGSIFSPKSRFGLAKRRSSMMNSTIKSKNDSLRNSLASIPEKKKKNNPLIELPKQLPQNDPQMISARTKKQAIENQNKRYQIFLKKRQQQNNTKKQIIQSQFVSKQYTFDYGGDVLGSQLQQGAIKHHGARMKLGKITKRQREDALFSNEVSKSISFNKKTKQYNTLDISATHQIPMFPQTTRTDKFLGISSQIKECKLTQFKKHYGGRYHRLENLHSTLEIKKNQPQQFDLQNSRKQIKDTDSIKNSLIIYKPHIPNQRKLALPKLRGVYKVLDRYEDD